MVRGQVTGWAPIQRISAVAAGGRRVRSLSATRWVSPTGVDATIVTRRLLGSGQVEGPVVVSTAVVAHDADLEPGTFVVDPQLCWHEIDAREFVVSPLLGVRLSVRATRASTGGGGLGGGAPGRLPSRPCRVLIEALPSARGMDPPGRCASGVDWTPGFHLGIVTKWPVPVDRGSEIATVGLARPNRLVPPPAAFPRDVAWNPHDHAAAPLEPSTRSAVVGPPC